MIKRLMQCAGALAVLGAQSALAATLQVVPAATQVGVGSTVQVEIRIDDLTDLAAPSLGAYDLDISFDAAILGFSGVTWGNQLDLAQLGSFAQLDDSQAGSGSLNLFEFSYDDSALLDTAQAGSFTLFTLTFDVLALGQSAIGIDINALGDAGGNPLTAQVTGAFVNAVPVPAALPLFASGLLVLVAGRRRVR